MKINLVVWFIFHTFTYRRSWTGEYPLPNILVIITYLEWIYIINLFGHVVEILYITNNPPVNDSSSGRRLQPTRRNPCGMSCSWNFLNLHKLEGDIASGSTRSEQGPSVYTIVYIWPSPGTSNILYSHGPGRSLLKDAQVNTCSDPKE